jgi:dTDP-4-dehydrorhamnose reductase
MRILITGDTGLLGPYLKTAFSNLGDVIGVSRNGPGEWCDLTDDSKVRPMLGQVSPNMIVHAAALTDVDRCEKQPNLAVRDNCGMVENLVKYMPVDCRFIYISTDMVYSGHGPHREHSRSENPINMYGMSKFMGEFSAAKAVNHLIVRTNMYGKALSARKSSLVDFFLNHFKSGDVFNSFTDSFFTPLWTRTLAEKLVIMARTAKVGTFNLGASTSMSKAKFAILLANEMGLSAQGMRPVASEDLPVRTPRPLDTRLDITRTEMAFALQLPSMESDIKAMCESIKCTN